MNNASNNLVGYFNSTFASLKHKSFRFYCLSVIISLTGTLMQEVVVAWLAYKLTGSSLVLGTILFCYQTPMLIIGCLGGWTADRFNRKRILLVTQSMAMCLSLIWLVLSWTDSLQIWHFWVISIAFGINVAFEIPARFAILPQLVDDNDCINAFALDSLLFYSARTLGPAIGAMLLPLLGATGCFAANSLTYAFELFVLWRIMPAPRAEQENCSISEAFRFIFSNPAIRKCLLLVAVFSFCGVYIPLMPVFTHLLGGSEQTNGFLIAASEAGAILASVFLAYHTSSGNYNNSSLHKTVNIAGIIYAVAIVLFTVSHHVFLSMALLFIAGFSITTLLIGSHALVQSHVSDRMRGVVSTVFWLYCFFGTFAIGGPVIGWCIDIFGAAATMITCSCICAIVAVFYVLKKTE